MSPFETQALWMSLQVACITVLLSTPLAVGLATVMGQGWGRQSRTCPDPYLLGVQDGFSSGEGLDLGTSVGPILCC